MNQQDLIDDLLTRGVENIIPGHDELKVLLESGKKLNVYLGIDPTATRIHLGHAFNLRKLNIMAELGHNVTFLVGDYTALIGDTSDKNDERPVLTADEIQENLKHFKRQASKFLDFKKVNLAYNSEWLKELNFKDILEIARHFSVNDFISRELIRNRLDEGKRVSLPETLYPLMQGYDSYHLDTDIQFGATDQTFNMQAGRTLNKRLRNKESFIIASGFLPGTDGRKMSKSWGNAVWIEDNANEVFGKVMSVSDEVLKDYFTLGTNLPLSEIEEVIKKRDNGELHPMEAKKILARQIVKELNGEDQIEMAEQHFVDTVQNKTADEEALTIKIDQNVKLGKDLIEIIVDNKLVKSASQAKRLFKQGAIRLNEEQIELDQELDFKDSNQLRVGKRRYINLEK